MLKEIYWHSSKRILIQRYSGFVSLEDLQQAREQSLAMIRAEYQEGTRIHFIVDTLERESYSADVLKLPNIRQLFEKDYYGTKLGWIIVVNPTPHPIMRFVSIAATRISNNKLRILPSLDDAIDFLYQEDSSLSNSPAS